jgi:DMSO/TMAO reductase YedYZ molybdopterin-dependent catalytic subunit
MPDSQSHDSKPVPKDDHAGEPPPSPAAEAPPPVTQSPDVAAQPPSPPAAEAHAEQPPPAPPAHAEQPPLPPPAPALGEKEVARLSRRELLKLSPLVLAGAFLIPKVQDFLLEKGVAAADTASGLTFRAAHLAPTFPDSMVVPFDNFPYNGYDVIDPEVDLENWTLTVEGQVARPGEYTLAQIQSLPKIVHNTRHVCVEGWDAIGNWGGARVSDFLRLVGADPGARFLEVECADDYYESIDMASVRHPQSLLCYEMYGKPLDRGHGAPLRLRMPTKLGYKQAKYLTTFRITSVLRPGKRGYWEDQGYAWHAGM